MCAAVTSSGGQLNGKKKNVGFLVFWETEDSSEGLVKVATHKKVYKCLEKVKHATHPNVNFIFSTKDLLTTRGLLQAAALIRPSVQLSVFVKSLHIHRKSLPTLSSK